MSLAAYELNFNILALVEKESKVNNTSGNTLRWLTFKCNESGFNDDNINYNSVRLCAIMRLSDGESCILANSLHNGIVFD